MSNKEKIIDLFYIKHLKPVDIALKLDVSNSYVTKVIKKDSRYHKEKIQRKQQNKVKHKEQTIEYIKAKQKSNKDSYEALKYQLKKDIPSYSKSTNYVPIITFFDENFNEINLITTKYNVDSLDNDCINNVDMTLKENYINSDLVSGSYLCINYYFDNTDSRIKYFAVGFQGVENYNKDNNYFANYYSKYYVN